MWEMRLEWTFGSAAKDNEGIFGPIALTWFSLLRRDVSASHQRRAVARGCRICGAGQRPDLHGRARSQFRTAATVSRRKSRRTRSRPPGMAGLAFNAQLLIAKVVTPDGEVPLQAEVAAIRWAADNGARVINLSLGGVRDPLNSSLDTYSPLEQAAVDYAYSKGAVVVAAVGNGPQSPRTPWMFADYPAALPHVIGVSAIRQDGSVPRYSNRDAIYVDLAAPGDGIFSTIPREHGPRRAAADPGRTPTAGLSSSGCDWTPLRLRRSPRPAALSARRVDPKVDARSGVVACSSDQRDRRVPRRTAATCARPVATSTRAGWLLHPRRP